VLIGMGILGLIVSLVATAQRAICAATGNAIMDLDEAAF